MTNLQKDLKAALERAQSEYKKEDSEFESWIGEQRKHSEGIQKQIAELQQELTEHSNKFNAEYTNRSEKLRSLKAEIEQLKPLVPEEDTPEDDEAPKETQEKRTPEVNDCVISFQEETKPINFKLLDYKTDVAMGCGEDYTELKTEQDCIDCMKKHPLNIDSIAKVIASTLHTTQEAVANYLRSFI